MVTGADSAAVRRLGRRFDGSRIFARLRTLAPDSVTVPDTVVAAYAALRRRRLVLAQLDDAVCNLARPNLPGTVDEWPNWCLPLPLGLEELRCHPTVQRVATVLNSDRPRPGSARPSAGCHARRHRPRRPPRPGPPPPLPDRPAHHRRGGVRAGRPAVVTWRAALRRLRLGRTATGAARRLSARGRLGLGAHGAGAGDAGGVHRDGRHRAAAGAGGAAGRSWPRRCSRCSRRHRTSRASRPTGN